ncbi:MAG: hypothetical protein L6Q93_13560 [Phycisphaerae bacterium]|nr:hypothetical protein [Phycisphaerae bacterium]
MNSRQCKIAGIGIVAALAAGIMRASPHPAAEPGSGTPSAKSHFYWIEYKRPVKGAESVATLDAIFFVKIAPDRAEVILRRELETVVEQFAPDFDVMASAWRGNDDPVKEERIDFPDESHHLIYVKKYKQIMRWKEYMAKESETPAGAKTLEVVIDANVTPLENGMVRVKGTTNLPDGMFIWVQLRNSKTDFFNQAKVIVADGAIASEWIGENKASGKPLIAGKYELTVSMPMPDFQPDSVKKVIGKRAELMSGKFITVGNYGRELQYKRTVEVK